MSCRRIASDSSEPRTEGTPEVSGFGAGQCVTRLLREYPACAARKRISHGPMQMLATLSPPGNLSLLQKLSNGYPGNFLVRLWDGGSWEFAPGRPIDFILILHHQGAL